MPSTTKRKYRKRRRRKGRTARRVLTLLAALLLAGAAFVVEHWGGQSGVPTWSQLYTALGVPMDGPDAELLAQSSTTVTVLDVGQGDSVLIGQDGEYCLIDTGTADTRDTLVRDLRLAGVKELRYLILTHPHADHTGGAGAVLEGLSVEELVLPVWRTGEEGEPAWPDGILDTAAREGTLVTETAEGDAFTLGSGAIHILQGGSDWMQTADDANNGSLCLLFEAGDTLPGHEFHRWDADDPGRGLSAQKPSGRAWRCAYVSETLYAGYPHLAFMGHPKAARRFIDKCLERKLRNETIGY